MNKVRVLAYQPDGIQFDGTVRAMAFIGGGIKGWALENRWREESGIAQAFVVWDEAPFDVDTKRHVRAFWVDWTGLTVLPDPAINYGIYGS